MRLTHLCEYGDKRKNKEPMKKIRNKLFELENIEDKLGIDLVTLFKAIKNGIYVKDLKGKITYVSTQLRLVFDNGILGLFFQCPIKWRYIQLPEDGKDYGKTWALTKEELIKEE